MINATLTAIFGTIQPIAEAIAANQSMTPIYGMVIGVVVFAAYRSWFGGHGVVRSY